MQTSGSASSRQFDIIARIRADLSGFRTAMSQMVSGFRESNNELVNSNTNTINQMDNAFRNRMPEAIGRTQNALGGLENKLRALFTLYAGKKLFDYTLGQGMQFEDYTGGFEAIYKGDKERANAKMRELRVYAQKTPYELPEVVEAGMSIEGVGMDTNKYLKPIGDLASFNKQKGATITSVAQTFRNAFTGNYGMAIEELRNMGIMQTDLARNGVRFAGNGSPVSSQKVFMEAMVKSIQQSGANDYMDTLSQKTSGMISNIKDSLANFGRLISEEFFAKFHNGIKSIMESLAKMESNGTLKAFGQMVARALTPLITLFQNLAKAMMESIESGKMEETLTRIGGALTMVGEVMMLVIKIIATLASWLFNLSGKGNLLSGVLWSLVSGFLAMKVIMTVIGWVKSLITVFRTLEAVSLALNISNPFGWVALAVTGIVFLISQVQALKDLLAGFLRWAGLGSMADMLSPDTSPEKSKDAKTPSFEELRKKAEEEAKKAEADAKKNSKIDKTDASKYADTGTDLENQMKGLEQIRDATIKIQETRTQTKLQKIELGGQNKNSSKYQETQSVGEYAMFNQYRAGMAEMQKIINMAGDKVENIGTKRDATQKFLDYQQKANQILLSIENNTNEIQNIASVTNAQGKLDELRKDVSLQKTELGGMRPETQSYWQKTRTYLITLAKDYQTGADAIKKRIPKLTGAGKMEAETQYLTLQKQANDLLLQIKKNTDPRNGTFNLPSGIKAYTLLESKQAKGQKAGMTVSGNKFTFEVKEVLDPKSVGKIMNQFEEKMYDYLDSQTRR
jgi:hypothetical protein